MIPVAERSLITKPLALLAAPVCFILGLVAGSGRPAAAWQDSQPEPLFYKFGKNYLSLSHVSHIVDEPGFNMPPGSLQIYFGGGNQSWLALYGDEAEAFRTSITKVSVDMTPKATAAAAAPAKKKSRRAVLAPPGPAPAPAAPPAQPQGPVFEQP
jgi:hypothetical protein